MIFKDITTTFHWRNWINSSAVARLILYYGGGNYQAYRNSAERAIIQQLGLYPLLLNACWFFCYCQQSRFYFSWCFWRRRDSQMQQIVGLHYGQRFQNNNKSLSSCKISYRRVRLIRKDVRIKYSEKPISYTFIVCVGIIVWLTQLL